MSNLSEDHHHIYIWNEVQPPRSLLIGGTRWSLSFDFYVRRIIRKSLLTEGTLKFGFIFIFEKNGLIYGCSSDVQLYCRYCSYTELLTCITLGLSQDWWRQKQGVIVHVLTKQGMSWGKTRTVLSSGSLLLNCTSNF